MELQNVREIRLDGTTTLLLTHASEANEELEAYRPFDQELGERLRNALIPDRITASLNMEGIVATRRQTLAVMDAMRISETIDRGQQEIQNALKADEFVHDAADRGLPLDAGMIRQINELLLEGINADAGSFRSGPVELPGAPFCPPDASDLPDLIRHLAELYPLGESVHPLLHAAWIHAQFTLIHPFSDGNGRTGRLLQDFTLLRRGFLPVGIPPSQRDDYYSALEKADRGEWDQFAELLADLEIRMITQAQVIATAPQRRTAWIQGLAQAAAAKATHTKHKKYLVWRQRMEQVSRSFKVAVDELDASSDIIGATYKDFGVVDFDSWKEMCRRGQIGRSWMLALLFYAEGEPFYKSIAYFKRHVDATWDVFERPSDTVSLYFTGAPTRSDERPDFFRYSDPHIRLRELLYVDDQLYVFHQPTPGEPWEALDADSLEVVVEGFFKDVFGRKAGLAI